MPRPSKIDQLPEDAIKALNGWLSQRGMTRTEAHERLVAYLDGIEFEDEPPSRHAVNRYAIKMDEIGARLQDSHQIAEIWMDKFGALPDGELGQLVVQMVRTLSFEAGKTLFEQGDLDAEELPGVLKMLRDLSMTVVRTERAMSLNAKRIAEIKRETAAQAADVAEKTLTEAGFSAETVAATKNQILGIA